MQLSPSLSRNDCWFPSKLLSRTWVLTLSEWAQSRSQQFLSGWWKPNGMETYGNRYLWKPMNMLGNIWKPVEIMVLAMSDSLQMVVLSLVLVDGIAPTNFLQVQDLHPKNAT